ncbi:MAG: patatin-like phospholipase family protein [Phycisphaerales bacterium]
MTHVLRAVSFALMLMLMAACSALPRTSVPDEVVEDAVVAGLPDIRTWGDDANEAITAWMSDRIERERAFMREQGIDPMQLPTASYLAISGGGENGAYSAGLICGWTQAGDRPEFRVVTGVSAGALVAPFVFAGPEYDRVLREVFTSIRTRDIVSENTVFSGLLGDSMYNSKPLHKLLEKYIDEKFVAKVASEYRKGRNLFIATTNLDCQRPVIWAMGRLANEGGPEATELFRDILVASASIPGVFPPVMIDVEADGHRYQEMHVDGGATSQVFLYPPSFDAHKFSQAMNVQRERTVYVIRNAQLRQAYAPVKRRTLAIAQRAVSSLIASQGVGDLYRIYLECKRDGMQFRLATIPPTITKETEEFFETKYMTQLFEDGFAKAKGGYAWVKAPPGFEGDTEATEK